jgi:hypothetical protein
MIDHYEPPDCPEGTHPVGGDECRPDETTCPEGQELVDGQCVPEYNECPDGSPPVNGQCIAPYADCPDGTRPNAEGLCNPRFDECPDGSTPENGWCQATGGLCPNGQEPVNGYCQNPGVCPDGSAPNAAGLCVAPWGTCPNGSQPVNGLCGTGEACDPETDPAQCTGDDEGNASGGETCNAPPACSGDVIACAQLRMQWSVRCAIEGQGEVEVTNPQEGGEGETADDLRGVQESDGTSLVGQISDSGFLGGGSCPELPSFTAFGHTFSFSDQPWWCDFLAVLGMIILAIGAFIALQILMD